MIGTFFTVSGEQVDMSPVELTNSLDSSVQCAIDQFDDVTQITKTDAWALLSLKVKTEDKRGKVKTLIGRMLISEQ